MAIFDNKLQALEVCIFCAHAQAYLISEGILQCILHVYHLDMVDGLHVKKVTHVDMGRACTSSIVVVVTRCSQKTGGKFAGQASLLTGHKS